MFENINLNDFWQKSEYTDETYLSEPVSESLILDIEKELGYKLPESYIYLMKTQNGGIPKKYCYRTNTSTSWADNHIQINGILGIGKEKYNSLCGNFGSKFWIEHWEYPDIGVAICDCPSAGHDMVFLDYRECGPYGEPKVVHIDQEFDYKITPLADSFEEFITKLCREEDL